MSPLVFGKLHHNKQRQQFVMMGLILLLKNAQPMPSQLLHIANVMMMCGMARVHLKCSCPVLPPHTTSPCIIMRLTPSQIMSLLVLSLSPKRVMWPHAQHAKLPTWHVPTPALSQISPHTRSPQQPLKMAGRPPELSLSQCLTNSFMQKPQKIKILSSEQIFIVMIIHKAKMGLLCSPAQTQHGLHPFTCHLAWSCLFWLIYRNKFNSFQNHCSSSPHDNVLGERKDIVSINEAIIQRSSLKLLLLISCWGETRRQKHPCWKNESLTKLFAFWTVHATNKRYCIYPICSFTLLY